MPADRDEKQWLRDRAYFIWEHEGHPEGRAFDHSGTGDPRGIRRQASTG